MSPTTVSGIAFFRNWRVWILDMESLPPVLAGIAWSVFSLVYGLNERRTCQPGGSLTNTECEREGCWEVLDRRWALLDCLMCVFSQLVFQLVEIMRFSAISSSMCDTQLASILHKWLKTLQTEAFLSDKLRSAPALQRRCGHSSSDSCGIFNRIFKRHAGFYHKQLCIDSYKSNLSQSPLLTH